MNKLKSVRLALGLTQKQMAQQLGYHVKSYQPLETGRRAMGKKSDLLLKALLEKQK